MVPNFLKTTERLKRNQRRQQFLILNCSKALLLQLRCRFRLHAELHPQEEGALISDGSANSFIIVISL